MREHDDNGYKSLPDVHGSEGVQLARSKDPLLRIKDLCVDYKTPSGLVHAVQHVNLSCFEGESLGLVGESGSGKSTFVLSVLRLLPQGRALESGEVIFNGVDLMKCSQEEMSKIRWTDLSIVFQQSMNTLSPVHKVSEQIEDIYHVHEPKATKEGIRARISPLLEMVNLSPRVLDLYPHELSGGMFQRINILLSLIHSPRLVVLDEATTALDVVTQGQILDELRRLEEDLDLTCIIVTHDIFVVADVCKRVAVMYAGNIVEVGNVESVLLDPLHPYTRGLIDSIPPLTKERKKIVGIPGELPDLKQTFVGCSFEPRCPEAIGICKQQVPQLQPAMVINGSSEAEDGLERGHFVACHKYVGDDL
mgnify:CR=1 FL=1